MLELLTKPLELTLGRRSRRKLFTIYRIIHFYTGSWHNDICPGKLQWRARLFQCTDGIIRFH